MWQTQRSLELTKLTKLAVIWGYPYRCISQTSLCSGDKVYRHSKFPKQLMVMLFKPKNSIQDVSKKYIGKNCIGFQGFGDVLK